MASSLGSVGTTGVYSQDRTTVCTTRTTTRNMTSLHPVLQPAPCGLQNAIVSLAAAFGEPGQDETMSIVIPLRIRYQRRVARQINMKLPSEDPEGLSDRAKFWEDLSDFYKDVLRFAAVRTLKPAIGPLHGDDEQIGRVIRWAERKRQANADLETYREKYLALRGSSSVLEELKKAFADEFAYTNFACEIYVMLCNEPAMSTVLQHLTLAPTQGDTEADRFAFESMLTTLFNKKCITLTNLGDTSLDPADWRSRHKGRFYQALRTGLVDLYQQQPAQLLAGRTSETGGPQTLLGEEMDIATMKMVLDDALVSTALNFAEQSISSMDPDAKTSLRVECWKTLFSDQLRHINVRRLLLEMHKLALKAGTSLQITTSTTSTSTTSSTFDLSDGSGAAFARELAAMITSEGSSMKAKFKGALFTLIKCLGASLDKLILVEPVESSRARPVVLIQGLSTVIQLRQTCLGIPDDLVITSLHAFTNIKAAADMNFDKIATIPDYNTYKRVMKSVAACLESALHSIVSWEGIAETFPKTMKNFLATVDYNDDWHSYRIVLADNKIFQGLPAFHGTSKDGRTDQHGVIAAIFSKWHDRYFNRLMGIQLEGDFAPLQQYFVMDQLASLAPDIHMMIDDARRRAAKDRIKGISPDKNYWGDYDDDDEDDDGGRGGRGGLGGRGGRGGK